MLRETESRERGAIALVTLGLLAALILSLAVTADLGRVYVERRSAQKAADLAALAAGQELPVQVAICSDDEPTAANVAATYLTENGWSVTCAELLNGNMEDGEIEFENPTPFGSTILRVTAPTRTVGFILGPAGAALLGDSGVGGVNARASAAVEVRSPTGVGILPFVVTSDISAGENCLNSNPPSAGDTDVSQPEACTADQGNFRYARIGRSTSTAAGVDSLKRNIAFGLDHNPFALNEDDLLALGIPRTFECDNGNPTGSVRDERPFTAAFSCLETETGRIAQAVGEALSDFRDPPGSDVVCDGRIGTLDPTSGDLLGNCYMTENLWESYQTDEGKIDISILDDPRFGFVPRVYTDDLQGNTYSMIIGFYGAYIDRVWRAGTGREDDFVECTGSECSGPNEAVAFISAELFELSRFTQDVVPNAGPTGTYINAGPKVVTLVE